MKKFKPYITPAVVAIGCFSAILLGLLNHKKISQSGVANITPTPEMTASASAQNTTGLKLNLPPDIAISTYASNLDGPRVILPVTDSLLLVSQSGKGQVIALTDNNGDGVADNKPEVILSSLKSPHGLAISNTTLYVAETNAVSTYDFDLQTHKATNKKKLFELPDGGAHWSRTLLISGDKLYVATGSSCNTCNEHDLRRASVWVSNLDGSGLRSFATGLRNSVFLTTQASTGKIWATENGRDLLGDDLPPDEINILEDGKDYGWPYCYGKNIHDEKFDQKLYKFADKSSICEVLNKTSSLVDIPAHSAPLGLAFVPKTWPGKYQGNLLVALHGSWNRSIPTGYKIILVSLDLSGNYIKQEDFISGWIGDKNIVSGRPVDLKFDSTNNLYVSDDKSGNIYRVSPLKK